MIQHLFKSLLAFLLFFSFLVHASSDKPSRKLSKEAQIATEQAMKELNAALNINESSHAVNVTCSESPIPSKVLPTVSNDEEQTKAINVFANSVVKELQALSLTDLEQNQLPIGLKKTIGQGSVEIAISHADFYSNYAELTVYVKIVISPDKDPLYFGAKNIRFTNENGISNFKAALISDVVLYEKEKVLKVLLKGEGKLNDVGEIPDNNSTYVEVHCGQFQKAQIKCAVEFDRQLLIPVEFKSGQYTDTGKKATASFGATFDNNKGELGVIGFLTFESAFESTKAKGFVFNVSNAFVDFSQNENPTGMSFPNKYFEKEALDPDWKINSWEGVYIQRFTITLPKVFKKKDGKRVIVDVANIVIDDQGFTGDIYTNTPLISLSESDADWKMSLENFGISLWKGGFTGASFGGQLKLPISNSNFNYTGGMVAVIDNGIPTGDFKYSIDVANTKNIDFTIFKGKGTLTQCEIKLEYSSTEKFKASAELSGVFDIGMSLSGGEGDAVKMKQIVFEGLNLKTPGNGPIICLSYLELKGDAGLAGFPVDLTRLGLRTGACSNGSTSDLEDFQALLTLGVKVNLAGDKDDDKPLGGAVTLNMLFEKKEDGSWAFKELRKPYTIIIDASFSNFSVKGEVEVFDEEEIDNSGNLGRNAGFRGGVHLIIQSPKIDVCVSALFASKDVFDPVNKDAEGKPLKKKTSYYFIGGNVSSMPEIPIAGPVNITGFSGAVMKHMRPIRKATRNKVFPNDCETESGVQYEYNNEVSFAFKAGVNLNFKTGIGLADGYAGFEMVFSDKGGLASLGFYAQAKVLAEFDDLKLTEACEQKAEKDGDVKELNSKVPMSTASQEEKLKIPPSETPEDKKTMWDKPMDGNIAARIGILMDFANKAFDCEANVYVDLGPLKGINDDGTNGPNRNLAGRAKIHFSTKYTDIVNKTGEYSYWFIHLGTSEQPIGLKLQIGKPNDLLYVYVGASAYFMVGYSIPQYLPPPSDEACAFFKKPKSYFNSRGDILKDGETNPNARKVVSENKLNEGNGLAFGVKFDAIAKAGTDIVGIKGAAGLGADLLFVNSPCGKGLSANGQFYVYIKASVEAFGATLVGFGVGALLKAGMPDPLYFQGLVHVELTLIFEVSADVELNSGNFCHAAQAN